MKKGSIYEVLDHVREKIGASRVYMSIEGDPAALLIAGHWDEDDRRFRIRLLPEELENVPENIQLGELIISRFVPARIP